MKLYTKEIDGITVIRQRHRIVVVKDGMQHINPTEDVILSDGWKIYEAPKATEADIIVEAIDRKREEILEYDSSIEVNSFYLGETQMWLDKSTRACLLLRIQAEQAVGAETTSVWYGGNEYTFPLEAAVNMLYALELYAAKCYDNTQRHLAVMAELTNTADIESYDYTTGYPEKLRF